MDFIRIVDAVVVLRNKYFIKKKEKTLSLNLDQKKEVVAEVSKTIESAQAMILAEYRGVGVGEMTTLRAEARKSGVYLKVLKNNLVKRAVNDTPFSSLSEDMTGPLLYGMSDDPVAAAKVLNDFAKKNDLFVIKLMGTMQAPIAKFVSTLNEVPSKFVRGLAAVRDQKSA